MLTRRHTLALAFGALLSKFVPSLAPERPVVRELKVTRSDAAYLTVHYEFVNSRGFDHLVFCGASELSRIGVPVAREFDGGE